MPSKFPNLLVNGATGIAVGMATSIPPHNLGEICDALIRVIDDPDVSIDELMEICARSRLPHRRHHLRPQRHSARLSTPGRGTIVVRARARIEEHAKGRSRIVVTEIPYQQFRDRVDRAHRRRW